MDNHQQTNGRVKSVRELGALFDRLDRLMDELKVADNKILDQMQNSCDEAQERYEKMKKIENYIREVFNVKWGPYEVPMISFHLLQ